MATLADLLQRVKKTIKDYTPLDELASSVRSYFDPTSNQGQNFWSTPAARKLGEIQQSLEQRTLPTVNLTQYAQSIKEPVPRLGAELGLGIAENILNIPQRLVYSGARAGQDVRTVLGGGKITPQRAIGTAAEVALPLIDIATLGGGTLIKGLGKQAIKQVAKEGLKSTIKRTAAEGALLGAGYGALGGAAEGNEAKPGNVLERSIVGGILGGTIAGIVGAGGGLLGLIKRSPWVERELMQKAKVQPKNPSTGKWVTTNLVKPQGMTKAQWEFQLEFNKKYNRNPYTPVYISDLKKAFEYELRKKQIGLSVRDINEDVSPFEEPKAGLPKPESSVFKFFEKGYDSYGPPHISKNGEYVNPRKTWLLKEKFVPPKLKEIFEKESNVVKGELDTSVAWPKEDPQPLKLAGYIPDYEFPLYILKLPSGQNVGIKKYYYDYLNKHIPNFRLGGFAPDGVLVIFSGDEKAGLVAPYKLNEEILSKIQPIKELPEVKPAKKVVEQAQPAAGGSQIGTVQSPQKTEGKSPKAKPQANIPSQTNAYTNIVSNKVKSGEPPTPDEVGKSIEERLNAFTQKVLGYNPQDVQGGQKGASFFTRTLRKGQEAVSTTVEKGLASQFTPVRLASQLLEGFFRGMGMSPERAQASAALRGGINLTQERSFNIGQALYDLLGRDEKSLARINAALDPELAKTKISFNDLTPQEKQVYNLIREGLDLVHDISYANGFLSPDKYLANKGKYTPRLYEPMELPPEVNEFVKQSTRKLNLDIFKKRQDVDAWKIENSLNNPVYGLAKRLSQVQMNMVVKKYTDFLASNSRYVSDTPKIGFTKLSESPVYGKLSGKYVLNSAAEDLKGFFFSNELLRKLYDVFRIYDRLPPRQLQKKLLTVFNPTTNVGNIVSDNVFGFLTGVNPLTLNKNILELKKNPREFRKLADYLMSKNIIGTDITRTDFVSQLAKVDELADIGGGIKQKLKDIASKAERFYGGTDDVYKTAAFRALLKKGYSLEEATRLVADGFQNYSTVGKFYDLWAKTPVVGEPFIKFQGDLIRIIKNAAINRPLHLITFLAALKGIAYLFSKLSGESDGDRITREQRYAAPYIPGLNIPLIWQTPFGEINVARYISPTFANRDTSTLMGRMLPFTPEMSKYGKDNAAFIAQNISDPLTAPLIQGLALDRDFRGKPIADPNETKFKPSTLTPEEKLANTATFIARSYTPPPINSAIDVVRAFQGKPNMYGAQQTPAQAVARLLGVKVQRFGPEEARRQREKDLEFLVRHNEFIDKQINSVHKQLLNKEITQQQADKRIANLERQKKTLPDVPQSGDKIRLLDKDGKLKIIDLSFQPTPPVLTGNTELDKKAVSKFNGEITKKANDIYDLYQAGKMSAQEAERELLKLKELKELKAKTGKTGGRKIKIVKPPTLKIKRARPVKTKTVSLKIKAARPRKAAALKIAKPKTRTVRIRIPRQAYRPIPIRLAGRA